MSTRVWPAILDAVEASDPAVFTDKHKGLAEDWTTCALSDFIDLKKEFPDLRNACIDEHFGMSVKILGADFYSAVIENNIRAARRLYGELEYTINHLPKKPRGLKT